MALGPPSSSPCTFEGGVEFVFLLSVGQIWSSSHYRWLILIPNPLSSSWQRFQTLLFPGSQGGGCWCMAQGANQELPTGRKAKLHLSKPVWGCALPFTPVALRSQLKCCAVLFQLSTSSKNSKMTWEVRRGVGMFCQGRLLECSVITKDAH